MRLHDSTSTTALAQDSMAARVRRRLELAAVDPIQIVAGTCALINHRDGTLELAKGELKPFAGDCGPRHILHGSGGVDPALRYE